LFDPCDDSKALPNANAIFMLQLRRMPCENSARTEKCILPL